MGLLFFGWRPPGECQEAGRRTGREANIIGRSGMRTCEGQNDQNYTPKAGADTPAIGGHGAATGGETASRSALEAPGTSQLNVTM